MLAPPSTEELWIANDRHCGGAIFPNGVEEGQGWERKSDNRIQCESMLPLQNLLKEGGGGGGEGGGGGGGDEDDIVS